MSDSAFTSWDASFVDVLGDAPQLARVVDVDAHEGPVYVADEDALYFTSLPRGTAVDIKRLALATLSVETVRANANAANGMTLGRDGRLVICEQGTPSSHGQITALDPATGDVETVVDSWRGLRFNSPNDVVVRRDGSIWFTDPSYGHLQGFKPEPLVGDYVYRHDPRTGQTAPVADSFVKPNGLAFSPDHSVLYVTDSGANQEAGSFYPSLPHHIVAFDVSAAGRHLSSERLFAVTSPGFPDGIKVDSEGRVYASSFAGVQVLTPQGDLIGEINLPGAINFAFGGAERNTLYITADSAIWAATLNARGPETHQAHECQPTQGA